MSQIQDLRNKKENQFNFIELLERLVDEKETKYVKMFDRLIKERINDRVDGMTNPSFGDNNIENLFIAMLFSNIILPQEMQLLNYFCKRHKEGSINSIDFQNSSIDVILSKAKELRKKELEAKKENMHQKIYENDEWLVLLPLSYETSLKYGANTKWCTAAKDTQQHFNNYTKNGILIYCINKKNNDKVAAYFDFNHKSASYSPTSALSFWDAEDNFREMFDVKMPFEIVAIVGNYIKTNKLSNVDLMKKVYSEFFSPEKSDIMMLLSSREDEIIEATKKGRSLHAVKLIKEIAGLGLKEAKELYDEHYAPQYYPRSN